MDGWIDQRKEESGKKAHVSLSFFPILFPTLSKRATLLTGGLKPWEATGHCCASLPQ